MILRWVVGGIRAPPFRQFMYHGVGSFGTVCGKSDKTVLRKDIGVVLLRIGRLDWGTGERQDNADVEFLGRGRHSRAKFSHPEHLGCSDNGHSFVVALSTPRYRVNTRNDPDGALSVP